jgi:NADPH:quinone reductase-like Zn-dependent oxidoreductase
MKAVGYDTQSSATNERSLVDLGPARPAPGPRDLLVSVRAVSVNPVDVKLCGGDTPPAGGRVLGFDCAGVAEVVGPAASLFRPGVIRPRRDRRRRRLTLRLLHAGNALRHL